MTLHKRKGADPRPAPNNLVQINLEVEANTQVSNCVAEEELRNTTTQGRTATKVMVEVDAVTGVGHWRAKDHVSVGNIHLDVCRCANIKTCGQGDLITSQMTINGSFLSPSVPLSA